MRVRIHTRTLLDVARKQILSRVQETGECARHDGTSSIIASHLHENGAAINVQLTSEDLQQIDSALSKIKVHGGRMNEEQMKVVDQTE